MINNKLSGRSTGAGNAEQAPPTAHGTHLRSFGSNSSGLGCIYSIHCIHVCTCMQTYIHLNIGLTREAVAKAKLAGQLTIAEDKLKMLDDVVACKDSLLQECRGLRSVSIYMYISMYICTHMYIHTCICACACTRARAHTHTHTHTHTHDKGCDGDEFLTARHA